MTNIWLTIIVIQFGILLLSLPKLALLVSSIEKEREALEGIRDSLKKIEEFTWTDWVNFFDKEFHDIKNELSNISGQLQDLNVNVSKDLAGIERAIFDLRPGPNPFDDTE